MNKPVVMRGLSPIERMIDMTDMRCTVCNAKAGTCDCWTKCDVEGCRWSYEKGGKCGNPNHVGIGTSLGLPITYGAIQYGG